MSRGSVMKVHRHTEMVPRTKEGRGATMMLGELGGWGEGGDVTVRETGSCGTVPLQKIARKLPSGKKPQPPHPHY